MGIKIIEDKSKIKEKKDDICTFYQIFGKGCDIDNYPLRYGHTCQKPPIERVYDYKSEKWWPDVQKIVLTDFPTHTFTKRVEREAIRRDCPLYNDKSAELCEKCSVKIRRK